VNLQNAEGVGKPNIVGRNVRVQLGVRVIDFGVAQRTLMKMDMNGVRGIMTATAITIETDMRGMETWRRNHKGRGVAAVGQEENEEIDERGKGTGEMMEQMRSWLRHQP